MKFNDYIQTLRNKSVAVIGTGVSNNPLIDALAKNGTKLCVRDMRSIEELESRGIKVYTGYSNVTYITGKDYLNDLDYDIIFRAPSLLPTQAPLHEAMLKGIEVTTEMEQFLKFCPCRVIAVTGSDGKTTTSTIIAELLKASGYKVHLGGNIGKPLLYELDTISPEDFAVVELSSFQLHSMKCNPDVSVITNISPNHLDKHPDMNDYVCSKMNIFKGQGKDKVLVLNADDSYCRSFAAASASQIRWFSLRNSADCYYDGQYLRINSPSSADALIDSAEIIIPGNHNILNYMAAYCAVKDYIKVDSFKNVAMSFGGVEHRLEHCLQANGIEFINDSIATSPNRTIAGLEALKNKPVIILGGYDKHLDFSALADVVCKKAKSVFITGDTAGKINDALLSSPFFCSDGLPVTYVPDFRDCIIYAVNSAENGDTVLFSPACASFDHFRNFEERGRCFKEIVTEWANEKIIK